MSETCWNCTDDTRKACDELFNNARSNERERREFLAGSTTPEFPRDKYIVMPPVSASDRLARVTTVKLGKIGCDLTEDEVYSKINEGL